MYISFILHFILFKVKKNSIPHNIHPNRFRIPFASLILQMNTVHIQTTFLVFH